MASAAAGVGATSPLSAVTDDAVTAAALIVVTVCPANLRWMIRMIPLPTRMNAAIPPTAMPTMQPVPHVAVPASPPTSGCCELVSTSAGIRARGEGGDTGRDGRDGTGGGGCMAENGGGGLDGRSSGTGAAGMGGDGDGGSFARSHTGEESGSIMTSSKPTGQSRGRSGEGGGEGGGGSSGAGGCRGGCGGDGRGKGESGGSGGVGDGGGEVCEQPVKCMSCSSTSAQPNAVGIRSRMTRTPKALDAFPNITPQCGFAGAGLASKNFRCRARHQAAGRYQDLAGKLHDPSIPCEQELMVMVILSA